MARFPSFPKDMQGAFDDRREAEQFCEMLENRHGAGTHYVYIGHGTYRYQVRPTPWFKRKKDKAA